MEKTFSQWSETVEDYLSRMEAPPLPDWVVAAKELADNNSDDSNAVLETADKYRLWLHGLKKEGFEFLQPGRFVMPDNKSDLYTLADFFRGYETTNRKRKTDCSENWKAAITPIKPKKSNRFTDILRT